MAVWSNGYLLISRRGIPAYTDRINRNYETVVRFVLWAGDRSKDGSTAREKVPVRSYSVFGRAASPTKVIEASI
jgi:hypothetical protein